MTTISDDKLNNKMTELANAIRTKFNKTNKMSVRDMITSMALPSYRPSLSLGSSSSFNLGYGSTISNNPSNPCWNDEVVINHDINSKGLTYYYNTSDYLEYPSAYELSVNYKFAVTAYQPMCTITGSETNPIPNYTGGNSAGDYSWIDSFTASNGIGHISGWHAAGVPSQNAKYHFIILLVDGSEIIRFTNTMQQSNDVYNAHRNIKTSNWCRFDVTFPVTDSRLYKANDVTIVLQYSDAYGDTVIGGDYYYDGKNGHQAPKTLQSSDKKLYQYPSNLAMNMRFDFATGSNSFSFQKNITVNADTSPFLYSDNYAAGKVISGNFTLSKYALNQNQISRLMSNTWANDTGALITINTPYYDVIRILDMSISLTKKPMYINTDNAPVIISSLTDKANNCYAYKTDNTYMITDIPIGYRDKKTGSSKIPLNSIVLLVASVNLGRSRQEMRNMTLSFNIGENHFYLAPDNSSFPNFDFENGYRSASETIDLTGYTIIKDVSSDSDTSVFGCWFYQNGDITTGLNENAYFNQLNLVIIPYQDSTVDVNFNNVNSAYQKLGKAFRNYYGKSDKMTVDDMINLLK